MGRGFTGVGDFTVNGKDVAIDGITSFAGGEFNQITIDGVVTVQHGIKANRLEADGVLNVKGNVLANRLEIDGVATLKKNLRCHTAEIDGVLNIKSGKLEADAIKCSGVIHVEGEINADEVTADGCISAKEIYGDQIQILSKPNQVKNFLTEIGSFLKGMDINSGMERFKNIQASKIEILEATKVNLKYVYVKQLCGTEITIGEGCYVENADCDGALRVSKYAVVKNVTGNHVYEELD